MIPSLTSGCPNFALSAATRMVQAIAVSQPPPSAKPLTAAITGLPRFSTRLRTSCPYELDFFRLDGGDPGELADVGSGDERLVASSGQDDPRARQRQFARARKPLSSLPRL